jgi:hypothetical protein
VHPAVNPLTPQEIKGQWKKTALLASLTFLLLPLVGMAQSALDGTWKIKLDNATLPKKPDVYLLQNGTYQCKTCVPPIKVKADGKDHQVTGHPYFDSISVKVVDDHSIETTNKKNGKVVTTSKTTVSDDGNTSSFEFTDSSATNADPVTGKGEQTRVSKGPARSHAVSGSWRMTKFENFSDNALLVTYKMDGDQLTMTSPTGQSYTAKLDGSDAPFRGDPGTTSVSVKRLSDSAIEEADKRNGKVIGVYHISAAPDGKTLTIDVNDKLHGTTSKFTAEKQ